LDDFSPNAKAAKERLGPDTGAILSSWAELALETENTGDKLRDSNGRVASYRHSCEGALKHLFAGQVIVGLIKLKSAGGDVEIRLAYYICLFQW